MSAKSTKSRSRRKLSKPGKPRPDYPLFAHDSGRWARKLKINGKWVLRYFGRWGNVKNGRVVPVENVEVSAVEALDEYNRQWPFLAKGETPPPKLVDTGADTNESAPTLRNICNEFLRSKRAAMLAGELSPRAYRDYERTTDMLIGFFGKELRVDGLRPQEFRRLRLSMGERLGPVAQTNEMTRVRSVFIFAWDNRRTWGLMEPADYGQEFKRPRAKEKRRARREAGPKMFQRDELLTILDALDGKPINVEGAEEPVTWPADPTLKAMVLLGINCGFGNTDVASLPQSAVDLAGGWIEFPRPKTEIDRRNPLWPATVEAVRAAIKVRPRPAGQEYRDLCFLTRFGVPWVRVQPKSDDPDAIVVVDPLSQRFSRWLKRLKINGRRGLGFYVLRHVFATIGGESKDPDAVSYLMGHADDSIAAAYREGISDDRLRDVVNHVREWLWTDERNASD